MVGCECINETDPHRLRRRENYSRPQVESEASGYGYDTKGEQCRYVPVARDEAKQSKQVIQSGRIETKAGITVPRVRFSKPARIEVTARDGVVEGRSEEHTSE